MSARMKARYDAANLDLIRRCTRLTDDTRVRLVVPIRVRATATIAECLAAKATSRG